MTELVPDDYSATLEHLNNRVHAARLRVQRKTNNELLQLWWPVGQIIRERLSHEAWGTNVLARLATDLREEFPTIKGFSPANLRYMRRFAAAWPDPEAIRQRPVGELPWGHAIEPLDKLDNQDQRDWYAAKNAHHDWSRPLIQHHISTRPPRTRSRRTQQLHGGTPR